MTTTLRAGEARASIDEAAGGRLASLEIDGLSLLVAKGQGPLARPTAWGAYPLIPWAGRTRNGRFRFQGTDYELPINWPPHSIHGTTFDRPWRSATADARSLKLEIDLGPGWPFEGHACQTYALADDGLDVRLEVHAHDRPFPASLGWHPWWRRSLERGGELTLDFHPGAMYARDAADVASAQKVAPLPPPWDDCFTDVSAPPILHWAGALRVQLESDADHWVVYDEPADALCVEPMTGPPDALNIAARIVEPGEPLTMNVRVAWSPG